MERSILLKHVMTETQQTMMDVVQLVLLKLDTLAPEQLLQFAIYAGMDRSILQKHVMTEI